MKKSLALLLVLVLTAASFMIIAEPVSSSAETVGNSWSAKTPMPQPASGARAAVVNGKIHVIGGSIHYVYDPSTDDWVAKEPMPTERLYFGIAVCQKKIYAIGGGYWDADVGWVTSNVTEVYDPATDSWESKTPMPTGRMSLSANEVNGKIYLIAGETGGPSSIVALNEVYDVANDTWTTKKPIHYPVDSYASAVVDGKIYVISGFEGLYHGTLVDYTQIYDPTTDSWSMGASLPESLRDGAAGATTGTLAPKRIYVIGGGPEMVALNLTQVYNPENDSWTMGAQMPTARGWLAVAVVNDLIYAIGGSPYVMGSSLPTNEQYVPFGFGTPDQSNGGLSPEIKLVSPENQTYHSASIPLEFSSNEPLSRMFYSLDNEGVTEVSGNTTITELSLGPHNLTVYATNEAGNAGVSQTVCFAIEEAEPLSPVVLVAAVSIAVVVSAAGLLVYFKKSRHPKMTDKTE
jgi:N-acetylneuraminic acid mutarotase